MVSKISLDFFKLGFSLFRTEQPLQGIELQTSGHLDYRSKENILKSSKARKGTVDPHILLTSRKGDRKIMKPPPARMRKRNQFSRFK